MRWLAPLVAGVAIALVHVYGVRLRLLERIPRSQWLSAAGGVSVAYVFLHLLPELAAGQRQMTRWEGEEIPFQHRGIYLMALAGLAIFYGLDRLALRSRAADESGENENGADEAGAGVFWVHVVAFGLYNTLIGALLVDRRESLGELALFAVAMGLHFLVNDSGLRSHHPRRYDDLGRWILAAAVLGGLAIGFLVPAPPMLIPLVLALLAGGIVLNVLKEEVPNERQSRFWAFVLGMVAYSGLLLAI